MTEISCPQCGSGYERIEGKEVAGGQLALHCASCGNEWARTPKPICSKCGSGDVEFSVVRDSWAFVDREAARGDPKAAFEYLDKESFRCRRCNSHWEMVHGTSPSPGTDEDVKVFLDDDDGYRRWLRAHYRGFVLNANRVPSVEYLVLHDATCRTISGEPARGRRWTSDYIKVCGMRRDQLVDWCRDRTGSRPTACAICQEP